MGLHAEDIYVNGEFEDSLDASNLELSLFERLNV